MASGGLQNTNARVDCTYLHWIVITGDARVQKKRAEMRDSHAIGDSGAARLDLVFVVDEEGLQRSRVSFENFFGFFKVLLHTIDQPDLVLHELVDPVRLEVNFVYPVRW